MRTETLIIRCAAIFLMTVASGCAVTHAPNMWSRDVGEMPKDVTGSWIWITLQAKPPGTEPESFGGELIAVSPDSLYVASPTLRVLARTDISWARLKEFSSHAEDAGSMSFFGSLLTFSNGWYLLFTWPIWIAGGSVATITRSFAPLIDYPSEPLEEMSAFARFPAGLPPGLERSTVIMIQDKRMPFGF